MIRSAAALIPDGLGWYTATAARLVWYFVYYFPYATSHYTLYH